MTVKYQEYPRVMDCLHSLQNGYDLSKISVLEKAKLAHSFLQDNSDDWRDYVIDSLGKEPFSTLLNPFNRDATAVDGAYWEFMKNAYTDCKSFIETILQDWLDVNPEKDAITITQHRDMIAETKSYWRDR